MKKFRCGDVVPGCTARFEGTENEILSQVSAHAAEAHGMSSVPSAVVDQVRARMVAA